MMIKKTVSICSLVLLSICIAACGGKNSGIKLLAEKGIEIYHSDYDEKPSFEYCLETITDSNDNCDYGLAYGLVYYICSQENLCEVKETQFEGLEENEIFLLDISKPLFDGIGIEEEDIIKVQAISVELAKYIVNEYSLRELIELALSCNIERTSALKNEWVHSLGYDYQYVPCITIPLYVNENEEKEVYPYYDKSDSVTFFFGAEDIKKYGYEAFFCEYRRIRDMMENDFADAREAFWKFDGVVEPVDIYTCFTNDNSYKAGKLAGLYSYDDNCIRLYTDWITAEGSLLHEYIHYLDRDFRKAPEVEMNKKYALQEAYADEVSTYECTSRLMKDALLQYFGEEYLETNGLFRDGEVDLMAYMRMYSAYILDISKDEVLTATGSKNGITSDVISWDYLPGKANGNFLKFAMEKIGKEKVIEATYNTKEFDKLISENYEELYIGWKASLVE